MHQRPAKLQSSGLGGDNISLSSLLKYLDEAHRALEQHGDEDGALRIEQLREFFLLDYKGGPLKFNTRHFGL